MTNQTTDAAVGRVWTEMWNRANQQTDNDEDDAHAIGFRDGFENAVALIDRLTGGDGEYRYCANGDPERHCPTPVEMISRIVARAAERLRAEQAEQKLAEAVGLLEKASSQMQDDLAQIEGEWGTCRSLETLEKVGEVPQVILATRAFLANIQAANREAK